MKSRLMGRCRWPEKGVLALVMHEQHAEADPRQLWHQARASQQISASLGKMSFCLIDSTMGKDWLHRLAFKRKVLDLI